MDVKAWFDSVEESTFLYVAGIVTVSLVVTKSAYDLYTHFIIYFTSAAVDYRRYGRWALVTGATDGIGKGIARQLAKLGINIVLVSRNPDKLRRVAREIESEFHVEAQCVTFDFTTPDDGTKPGVTSSPYDVIANAIRDLEIGILVNNVGMLSNPSRYLDLCAKEEDNSRLSKEFSNVFNCNDLSMLKMTELVLPQMLRRGKGLVVNLSSLAGFFVVPLMALYSSTKRFNDSFSKAISYECEFDGVVIQSIMPSIVHTNMTSEFTRSKPNFLFPDFNTYARKLLKSVGKARMTHGCSSHAMQIWCFRWIPESLTYFNMKVMRKFDRFMTNRRHRVKESQKKFQ